MLCFKESRENECSVSREKYFVSQENSHSVLGDAFYVDGKETF